MQSATVILAFLALFFGFYSFTCGIRIRNDDVPFLASVRFMGHHRCSGAVIAERLVITAAQCVERAKLHYLEVAVGSQMKLVHQVLKVMVHPQYDPLYQDYNIALIKTKTPFQFNESVVPIELANAPSNSAGLMPSHIFKWDSNMNEAVVQEAIPVPVNQITAKSRMKSQMIYVDVEGPLDDVGSLLVHEDILHGVLSGGRHAAIGDHEVGVFASLYPYAHRLLADNATVAAAGDSNDELCDALRTIIRSLKDMPFVPGFLVSAVEYLAKSVGCKY
ncbi:trypsin 5G1-like [Ischnura elegans]|uniref:trypsin 5G1-like n=1 Tax=Ischnura elegans TaxID=197161 RepID=UPI001ED8A0C0|nr:trypsin 5G1-like [Ischnura elegans]